MSSRTAPPRSRKRAPGKPKRGKVSPSFPGSRLAVPAIAALLLAAICWWIHANYAVSFQSPVRISFQPPILLSKRVYTDTVTAAQADQNGRALTAWQQYACRKFGPDCRLALAIQRAENTPGACEVYHYNTNGTLDWGYFQINTVHLERPGLNLRDLLDCKANIDFAYQLYVEKGGFSPWSTYKNGAYRRYMKEQ